MPIQPDDIELGSFVASTSSLHNFPPGTPLYVTAVSLPFLAVRAINSDTSPPLPITVNACLYKISDSYVQQFFPSPTTKDHITLRGYSVHPTTDEHSTPPI